MSSSKFAAADYATDGKKHLLLCASGSVATIKIPDILQSLAKNTQLSIRLVFTKVAISFLKSTSSEKSPLEILRLIPNVDGIYLDGDEWVRPWKRGDQILHIELRRWADIMVIAPLSANTQAKIVAGLADNLLTSIVRAWDTQGTIVGGGGRKRIILAPAMNTAMWIHPVTKLQLRVLEYDWGIRDEYSGSEGEKNHGWIEVLRPVEKVLACGDVGDGAMREVKEIVEVIENRLKLRP